MAALTPARTAARAIAITKDLQPKPRLYTLYSFKCINIDPIRRLNTVIFDEEKSLSGAADVADIDSSSNAIFERITEVSFLCRVESPLGWSSKSL
jgi:hypothetical protein